MVALYRIFFGLQASLIVAKNAKIVMGSLRSKKCAFNCHKTLFTNIAIKLDIESSCVESDQNDGTLGNLPQEHSAYSLSAALDTEVPLPSHSSTSVPFRRRLAPITEEFLGDPLTYMTKRTFFPSLLVIILFFRIVVRVVQLYVLVLRMSAKLFVL